MEALAKADKRKKPNPDLLFTDVYDRMPKHLEEQRSEMYNLMSIYPDRYPLDQYEPLAKS